MLFFGWPALSVAIWRLEAVEFMAVIRQTRTLIIVCDSLMIFVQEAGSGTDFTVVVRHCHIKARDPVCVA